MKRLLLCCIVLILALSGCSDGTVIPEKGDFSYQVTEGYSIADVTDKSCAILRDSDGQQVGGVELTSLRRKDLWQKNSKNIMAYLQEDFHKAQIGDFFMFDGSKKDPVVSINLNIQDPETQEIHSYSHRFFDQDSAVYHLWLDRDVLGEWEEVSIQHQ